MKTAAVIFLKGLSPKYAVGGKQATALWLAHCLKDGYDTTLFYLGYEVGIAELNQLYGTDFSPENLKLISIKEPRIFSWPLAHKLWLLKRSFLWKKIKKLTADFDLIVSAQGEMDLGRPIVQYINYPSASLFFLKDKKGFLKHLYYFICQTVYPRSLLAMKKNLTLTNSFYTSRVIKQVYEMSSLPVYLPVAPFLAEGAGAVGRDREQGFVLISRIHPEKNIDKVIDILRKTRDSFPQTHLHIIGSWQDKKYGEYLKPLIEQNKDWVFYEGALKRDDYLRLIRQHQYGIHGMPNEHFGIVVAEMISLGLIVFVPSDGGQMEIVSDARLIYNSPEQAEEKIKNVLVNIVLQQELLAKLKKQSDIFTASAFSERINQAIQQWVSQRVSQNN